jgi:hypothetical protein
MANYWGKQNASRVVRSQQMDWTGSGTVASTTFTGQTVQIRAVSDVKGYLSFASTGISSSSRGGSAAEISAGQVGEYFTVSPGGVVAWSSTSTSSGSVLISEMS